MHKELKGEYNAQMAVIYDRLLELLKSDADWSIIEHEGVKCIKTVEEVLRIDETGTRNLKLETIIDAVHSSPVSYRGIELNGASFSVAKGNDLSEPVEMVYSKIIIKENQKMIDLELSNSTFKDDKLLSEIYKKEQKDRVKKQKEEAERVKQFQESQNAEDN